MEVSVLIEYYLVGVVTKRHAYYGYVTLCSLLCLLIHLKVHCACIPPLTADIIKSM